MKIKLLDLCCGAGGAAMGYYRAAEKMGIKIEITGIDIKPQPNYPFRFIQRDAVAYLQKYGHRYTHIHASPPCQQWTPGTAVQRSHGKEYTDIIAPIRELMTMTGRRGVIENVPQAPIRKDVALRGDMFGLKVIRRRHFELVNWFMLQHHLPRLQGGGKDRRICMHLWQSFMEDCRATRQENHYSTGLAARYNKKYLGICNGYRLAHERCRDKRSYTACIHRIYRLKFFQSINISTMALLITIMVLALVNAGIASILYACTNSSTKAYNPLFGHYRKYRYSNYFHLSWLFAAVSAVFSIYIRLNQ